MIDYATSGLTRALGYCRDGDGSVLEDAQAQLNG